MAYRCIPPLKDSLEGRTEAVLAERQAALLQQLLELVGTVKGSPGELARGAGGGDSQAGAAGAGAAALGAPGAARRPRRARARAHACCWTVLALAPRSHALPLTVVL